MRRSVQVAAPLLASTALALLAGCHQPEMQRCVDENNKVVDDQLCANQPGDAAEQRRLQDAQNAQRQHNGLGILPYIALYHYYYGGTGSRDRGSFVYGGSLTPVPGRSYVNSSGVRSGTSRGGFGSFFSEGGAHSSGGHGGGGE